MKLSIVGGSHPSCGNVLNWDELSDKGKGTFKAWGVTTECEYSVVATKAGKVVGVFRFSIERTVSSKSKVLFASGTWVEPKYRKTGLAMAMWRKALKFRAFDGANVVVTSMGGFRLVTKLARKRTDLEWEILVKART